MITNKHQMWNRTASHNVKQGIKKYEWNLNSYIFRTIHRDSQQARTVKTSLHQVFIVVAYWGSLWRGQNIVVQIYLIMFFVPRLTLWLVVLFSNSAIKLQKSRIFKLFQIPRRAHHSGSFFPAYYEYLNYFFPARPDPRNVMLNL